MKDSVILMCRRALFQRREQGSRIHSQDAQTENEGPQALKSTDDSQGTDD